MLIFSFCSLHTSYLRLCLVVVLWAAGQGFLSLEWLKFNVFQCFHNVFQCFPKAPGPDSSGLFWGLDLHLHWYFDQAHRSAHLSTQSPQAIAFLLEVCKSDSTRHSDLIVVNRWQSKFGIRLFFEIRSQIKCALPTSSLVQSPACPNVSSVLDFALPSVVFCDLSWIVAKQHKQGVTSLFVCI